MVDTITKLVIIAIIVIGLIWGWWVENGPNKHDKD